MHEFLTSFFISTYNLILFILIVVLGRKIDMSRTKRGWAHQELGELIRLSQRARKDSRPLQCEFIPNALNLG